MRTSQRTPRRTKSRLVEAGGDLIGAIVGSSTGATVYLLFVWFLDDPPNTFGGAIGFGVLALLGLTLLSIPISLTLLLLRGVLERLGPLRSRIILQSVLLFVAGNVIGLLFSLLVPNRDEAEFQGEVSRAIVFLGAICGLFLSPWVKSRKQKKESSS